jgi:hypothetical protein
VNISQLKLRSEKFDDDDDDDDNNNNNNNNNNSDRISKLAILKKSINSFYQNSKCFNNLWFFNTFSPRVK